MLAQLREQVVDRALRICPSTRSSAAAAATSPPASATTSPSWPSAVVEALPAMAGAALTIVLTFVGMAAVDLRLAAAGLLAVPIQLATLRWYIPRAAPAYAAERVVSGERAQALLDVVGGAPTVRALGLGPVETDRVRARSQASVDAVVRNMRLATRFYGRLNVAELVGVMAVLVAGFLLVRAGSLSIGGATAGALLFVRLFDQFNIVLGLADDAQRALAALARLVGIARLEPPADPAVPAEHARHARSAPRGVSHAYDAGHDVLHDVDLDLADGRARRAGRRLGRGQDDAGEDRRRLPRADGGHDRGRRCRARRARADGDAASRRARHPGGPRLRRAAGRRPAAGRARTRPTTQLRRGARAGGRARLGARLPDGLATVVGAGGVTLTAAQAQQVALARLRAGGPARSPCSTRPPRRRAAPAPASSRPRPTACSPGRTALVVAHRLTQAARADRVVVLEHGRVVEDGHARRAAGRPAAPYAALWAAWSAGR